MFSCLAAPCCFFFFFNDTATTEIYTLSLHDALPIFRGNSRRFEVFVLESGHGLPSRCNDEDRKSTRLNSSHVRISYAVFCLKKKKTTKTRIQQTSHLTNLFGRGSELTQKRLPRCTES